MGSGRILVVDDDEPTLDAVAEVLSELGYTTERCHDAELAKTILEERDFDAVVTDLRLPGVDGIELSGRIAGSRPDVPVVVMTAYGDATAVSRAMRSGVVDFLEKPFTIETLSEAVERAIARRQRSTPIDRLPPENSEALPLPGMVGSGAPMRALARRVRQAALAACPVLVTGETGTGKELVARSVHAMSERSSAQFVALNCATLSAEMIESELFGHTHGAFTGAVRTHSGLFRAANGGTLVLDEIGAMPIELQSRLLRAMEVGAVRSVGSIEEEPVDVRIVAATNANLEDAVTSGTFRSDLLIRLEAFTIELPPLRARGDDIVEIARHFVGRFAAGGPEPEIDATALRVLRRYQWPGNVRELENSIQAALVAAGSGPITVEHLPKRVRESGSVPGVDLDAQPMDLGVLERLHIQRVLEEVRGNRSVAARRLGIDRVTLYRKLKRFGLG
jgi:two-component system, NtrC family, response regulator AtoC